MRTLLITKPAPRLLEKVEAACRGGIDAVQLREKTMEGRELYLLASKMREITRAHGVLLFINSCPDIALATGADGVHFPEETYGPKRLLTGRSVHSIDAVRRAEREGSDFLVYSPIFASKGKGEPAGLDNLRLIVGATSLPVYALGGVFPKNIPSILETGARGAAAISAILDALDVEAAARAFAAPFREKRFAFKGVLGLVSGFDAGIAAIQNGVEGLQFRHKGPFTREAFDAARSLCETCRAANIPFFVNDRADIAEALDATGVHLGQKDIPIREARRILGKGKVIGASVSNEEEALAAVEEGADYVGLGHVFPTNSKVKLTPPIGLETVRRVKKRISVPLIAIGGIDETNAALVFQAGADGIAVLSKLARVLCHG